MHLTESTLGSTLKDIFPNHEFIHDKIVPNSNCKFRPDYRCDELMTIVEFDGFSHYNSSKRIKSDVIKDNIYSSMGYDIIRVPYFLQLSTDTIASLFKIHHEYEQSYNHGFISSSALLPADFCELGVDKFCNYLLSLQKHQESVYIDILQSLKIKVQKFSDIDIVMPKSLQYLIA